MATAQKKPRSPKIDLLASNHTKIFYIAITALGLVIRLAMVLLSPRYGYFQDHDDLIRWALQCADEGAATLYDRPPKPIAIRVPTENGAWQLGQRETNRLCNYPPLCALLLSASGGLFRADSIRHCMDAVDPSLTEMEPEVTGLIRHGEAVNTLASRSVIAIWGILADVLLAWGCASLTMQLTGGNCRTLAYAIAFLAPPFWIVSSLWGQVDTWVLAPAVWMIRAMTAGQWGLAGLLYGITAAIKPQAAAFIPIWGLAIFVIRPAWRPMASLAIAAVVLNIIALPFWMHSGAAWWQQSYQENLFEHSKGMTTLMAFNIWYLDCLLTGSVDETAIWLGVSKAMWGQLGLGFCLILGFVWTLRRWANNRGVFVIGSLVLLLAFVMIPTRVHDRFILLVLPFLIVAAILHASIRPGVVILLIAATGQVTWPQWLSASSADWEFFEKEQRQEYPAKLASMSDAERAQQPSLEQMLDAARQDYVRRNQATRPYEWILTLLSITGAVAILTGTAATRRDRFIPK